MYIVAKCEHYEKIEAPQISKVCETFEEAKKFARREMKMVRNLVGGKIENNIVFGNMIIISW